MSSKRKNVFKEIALGHKKPDLSQRPFGVALDLFGHDVFSLKTMRSKLPKDVFLRLKNVSQEGGSLNPQDADVIANSMKDWAIERGATHYAHWFQPMTGQTAEKHDAFLSPTPEGQVISEFSGKMLISGEPDASSFPSGGLRSTFEARGYTVWDPTSPAFLLGDGPISRTLYIPTVFYSYTGEALDRKTPLLRSIKTVSEKAKKLLSLLGQDVKKIEPMVGAEQEYFLVDRRLYLQRPDLMMCGRTLYGAQPAKGQELENHYFGSIPARVLEFMQDAEQRLNALGVPIFTRHNEAAPGQFEAAPIYETANIAADHNLLIMKVFQQTAAEHDLTCLLHEKPFSMVNGSGKHNNWSLSDDKGRNLCDPGPQPWNNLIFLMILAAVMRAAHRHSAILRLGTVGAGNDHRLGSNEAPPAILSLYLGKDLENIIDGLILGLDNSEQNEFNSYIKCTVDTIPTLQKDTSDRNRTSPLAFTGNKFEYRALGASQSVATINLVFNVAVASALDDIIKKLEKKIAGGLEAQKAAWELLPKLFEEHRNVVFSGDNYSPKWVKEAEKRGLLNLKDTVSALEYYSKSEVMEIFIRQGVFSSTEIISRQGILFDGYIHHLILEAKLTLNLGRTVIWPACLAWQKNLGEIAYQVKQFDNLNYKDDFEYKSYLKIKELNTIFDKNLTDLKTYLNHINKKDSRLKMAVYARETLLPAMNKCRDSADELEGLVDDQLWPLPSHAELFWLH